jgi:hypothetical protein
MLPKQFGYLIPLFEDSVHFAGSVNLRQDYS